MLYFLFVELHLHISWLYVISPSFHCNHILPVSSRQWEEGFGVLQDAIASTVKAAEIRSGGITGVRCGLQGGFNSIGLEMQEISWGV